MLFKILHGDESRISTDITPFHEGYCYVTHDGYMYVDMNIGTVASPNNQRIKLNAKDAETLAGLSVNEIIEQIKDDTDLSNYYTKTEIDNLELITVNDIDVICGVVVTISFTINDIVYQANEGMTWTEWVTSDYNTGGFYLSSYDTNAVLADMGYYVKLNNNNVLLDDVIIAGQVYAYDDVVVDEWSIERAT